jgi:hypothetical protein
MGGEMWRLDEFRFDHQIASAEVHVWDPDVNDGEVQLMERDDAIARAHSKGLCLIAEWPEWPDEEPTSCIFAKVSLPLRWERIPDHSDEPTIDERLWFEADCGGRDFLLGKAGWTFRGRMSAWCPKKKVSYRVSLSEMGTMSDETRYFVRGFLAGNAPNWPKNDDPDDFNAWLAATSRFQETGYWYGRWGTCATCGCVLLPETAEDHCAEHPESPEPPG